MFSTKSYLFRFYCSCEKSLNLDQKLDESECNIKCPGNSSQICGGYFGPRSVFNFKSILSFIYKICLKIFKKAIS